MPYSIKYVYDYSSHISAQERILSSIFPYNSSNQLFLNHRERRKPPKIMYPSFCVIKVANEFGFFGLPSGDSRSNNPKGIRSQSIPYNMLHSAPSTSKEKKSK